MANHLAARGQQQEAKVLEPLITEAAPQLAV
jgi:hypothetical protein